MSKILKSSSECVPSGEDIYFNCGKGVAGKCCSGTPINVGGKMVCPGTSSGLCSADSSGNPCIKNGGDVYYDCCKGGIGGKAVACCNGKPPVPNSSGALICGSSPTPTPSPSPSGGKYSLYKNYTNKDSYKSWKNYGTVDKTSIADYTNSYNYISDITTSQYGQVARFSIANSNTNNKRQSHRIETVEGFSGNKFNYKNTLVIADIRHMPEGCGTWPAFWVIGRGNDEWPVDGELDIIEMVNSVDNNSSTNLSTLHTYNNPYAWSKSPLSPDCYTQRQYMCPSPQGEKTCPTNKGACCSGCLPDVNKWGSNSFGYGFNQSKGGIYAFEFDKSGVLNIWFWSRSENIPTGQGSPLSSNPDPKTWKSPIALWTVLDKQNGVSLPLKNLFKDGFDLVLNTALCGSWVGSVWNGSQCRNIAHTCEQYFGNNPDTSKIYWDISSIKVFNESTSTLANSMAKSFHSKEMYPLDDSSNSETPWYTILIIILVIIVLAGFSLAFIKINRNDRDNSVLFGNNINFLFDDDSSL